MFPRGNGFTKSAKLRHWVGFSFKIKKSPRRWDMCCPRAIFFTATKSNMFSEGSLQSFIPERVTINIRGGGGGGGS